jgi:hypothetical protein
MKLFVLGGKSGGTNYVAYDASGKEAEMSTARTKIRDDVTSRAYGAALNADVYRDLNVDALNEGLGFLTKYLDTQIEGATKQSGYAKQANNELIPSLQGKADSMGKAVTSSLMDYINQSTTKATELGKQFNGGYTGGS